MDKPHLERVARAYMDAALCGDQPTVAVIDTFGCPRSTAGRWVAEARQAGLITPSRGKGTSPRMNRRAIAVAEAIGVEPELLIEAIREHAAGDLRI